MAEFLLQIADDGSGAVPGTRPLYSVDETEEHAAPLEGRGTDHAFRVGVLRLVGFDPAGFWVGRLQLRVAPIVWRVLLARALSPVWILGPNLLVPRRSRS